MSAGAGVLRELVAKLAYETDPASFQQASQNIARLKKEMGELEVMARRALRGGGVGGGAMPSGGGGGAAGGGGGGGAFGGGGGAMPGGGRPRGRIGFGSALALKARGAYLSLFGAGASRNEALAGHALPLSQRYGHGEGFGGAGPGAPAQSRGGAGAGLLGSMGGALIGLGVGTALTRISSQMVKFASDANETNNVLEQVFGPAGQRRVQDWANVTSKDVGRSKYTLRDYAGQLGAMLEPMTGSAEKAEGMSKDLAKLSIDLASFFNTADSDALAALKSGIAGEMEPLRRYGIVLTDAALQEFAHTKGINKKITAMTVAEKTELRYQYIMAKTTKAQGDAARTADGFANASRALKDAWKDFVTEGGQRLLPVAGKLIVWARDAITYFGRVSEKSNIVQGSIAALAAAMVVAAGTMSAAFVVPALIIGGLALAIDEIITMLDGGQTLFGDWLDKNFGTGTTDRIVQGIHDFQKAVPDVKAAWEVWSGAIDDTAESLGKFIKLLSEVPLKTLKMVTGYGTFYGRGEEAGKLADAGKLGEYYGYDEEDQRATQGMQGRALSADEQRQQKRAEREANIKADADARKAMLANQELHKTRFSVAPDNRAGLLGAAMPMMPGQPGYGVMLPPELQPDAHPEQIQFGRARVYAPASGAAGGGGGGGGGATVVNMTNNTTVNMNGSGAPRDARNVANVVDKANRRALDNVKRTVK